MSRVIQYRRFGGTEVLEMVDTTAEEPGLGEVRIRVEAAGLNPMDEKVFHGAPPVRVVGFVAALSKPAEWFSPKFPKRVGHDFVGTIDAVGSQVNDFAVGDVVLGTLRGAPGAKTKRGSLAESLIAPVDDVVHKPESLSIESAATLGVSAQTACGALREIDVRSGDVVVISAAAGGVGSLAVQLATHRGATVIGIAGESNADFLRSLGVIPVAHGAGVKDRVLAAAPGPVTKILDCYGGEYVKLGFSLGLRGSTIGTLVPSPKAILRGARFTGSRHAQPGDLEEVAALVASGAVKTAIARAYPFEIAAVREAFTELATGHVRGKLVIDIAAR
ncbi:NADP-dependent oxidoreductase [Microbacterium sp. SORGH_AS_0888]|uniref:NADP-dependent oxidoreductase n=1 Tax=Microbacterium sp. SORGH_AS_0888 TaxID=3041791 RepID=UPI002786CEFB|nr:NADP-dependent oxidoreductase [Microbacterium sp. SORGH_AS_0888]MDQ1128973.1 NADPH:quinone reductase-like Zn-dependent oxidoreductase [Microbacterium sp. SORGH_AS_0888]